MLLIPPELYPICAKAIALHTSPEAPRAAMAEFIEFYNYHRRHEGIGHVTPADVYYCRLKEILKRRME